MSEYNQYITSVNKIFDYLSKMKAGWDALDNSNYISSIEEYKEVVISSLELFKKQQPAPPLQAPTAATPAQAQVVNQQPKEVAK